MDSSKPNLKNEDQPGTEIQLCTLATIQSYFEAAERATGSFFSRGSLRASLQYYRAIFLISIFFFL